MSAEENDTTSQNLPTLALTRATSACRGIVPDHATWCLIVNEHAPDLVLGVIAEVSAFDSMQGSALALAGFQPSARSREGHPVSLQRLRHSLHPQAPLSSSEGIPVDSQLWRLTKEGYMVNRDGSSSLASRLLVESSPVQSSLV
jgi:hypothetical protein